MTVPAWENYNITGTTYYLDPDNGNDSWDGTAQTFQGGSVGPKATWNAARDLLTANGDGLLVKPGSTVTNSTVFLPNMPDNVTFATWDWNEGNPGGRATLDSGTTRWMSGTGPSGTQNDGLFIAGFDIKASGRDGSEEIYGIQLLTGCDNLKIQDCSFSNFWIGLSFQGTDASATFTNGVLRGVQIYDNWSTSAGHAQGFYADNTANGVGGSSPAFTNWVIEDCLVDKNGFDDPVLQTGGSIFRHNIYHNADIWPTVFTWRRCISARGNSHGAQFRSSANVEDSLFMANAVNCLIGSSLHPSNVLNGSIVRTVIWDGRDITVPAERRGWGLDLEKCVDFTLTKFAVVHMENGTGSKGISIDSNDLTATDVIIYDWGSSNPAGHFWDADFGVHNTHTMLRVKIEDPSARTDPSVVAQASDGASFTWTDCQFFPNAGSTRYLYNSIQRSFSTWIGFQNGASSGNSETRPNFTDDSRTPLTYHVSKGGTNTMDDLMTTLRSQTRQSWNDDYSADVISNWVRNGYDIGDTPDAAGNPRSMTFRFGWS